MTTEKTTGQFKLFFYYYLICLGLKVTALTNDFEFSTVVCAEDVDKTPYLVFCNKPSASGASGVNIVIAKPCLKEIKLPPKNYKATKKCLTLTL